MQKQTMLFPVERRKKILEIVEKEGRITVSDIQRIFLVGYETAKKIWHCLKAIINSNVFTVAQYR